MTRETRSTTIAARQRTKSLPSRLPSSEAKSRNPALLISEEAQDIILSHVTLFKSRVALATLAGFAATSHRWRESGQRALYRQPLRGGQVGSSWRRAESLRLALKRPALANLVRSLAELTDCASQLEESRESKEPVRYPRNPRVISSRACDEEYEHQSSSDSDSEGKTSVSAYAWARDVQRSCLRVISSAFPVKHESHIRAQAAQIGRLQQLQQLHLVSTPSFDLDECLHEFTSWCDGNRTFERVTIEGYCWDVNDAEDEDLEHSDLGLRFRELVLLSVDLTWGQGFTRLFPVDPTILTTLYISTFTVPEPDELVSLVQAAGAQLQVFTLRLLDCEPFNGAVYEYADDHEGYLLPSTLFTSTPAALRRLSLQNGQDMSAESLLDLCHSSPLLEHLDFTDSTWWSPSEDHDVGCYHWNEDVVAALLHLPLLRYFNLGWLPLTPDIPLPQVEEYCRDKGIELQWMCCRPDAIVTSDEGSGSSASDSEDESEAGVQSRWARQRQAEYESDVDDDEGNEWVGEEEVEDWSGEGEDEDSDGWLPPHALD